MQNSLKELQTVEGLIVSMFSEDLTVKALMFNKMISADYCFKKVNWLKMSP